MFFTFKGADLFTLKLPLIMQNKKLYPSVTLGSREDSFLMNFTGGTFQPFSYDLSSRLRTYYFEIHEQISNTTNTLSMNNMSRFIRDHLEHQGFFSTLKAIDN
jgi:hypothetical protein